MVEHQPEKPPPSKAIADRIERTPPENGEEKSLQGAEAGVFGSDNVERYEPPYTILSEKEKIFTIIMASFAAFISPVSSSIYYPALNPLARDLNVSVSKINLSITVYMVLYTSVFKILRQTLTLIRSSKE